MFRKVALTAVAVLAVSAVAFAGDAQVAKGKVKSVDGNTVTVAGEDGQTWSFEATAETKVIAEGAAHKSEELASVGQKTEISQFVRENQWVTVKYWEKDGTRYMSKLRVH